MGCKKVGGGLGICSLGWGSRGKTRRFVSYWGGRCVGQERSVTATKRFSRCKASLWTPELGRGLQAHRRLGGKKGPPGATAWGRGGTGISPPTRAHAHTHARAHDPRLAHSRPPLRALRARSHAAAATHPPRGSGSPTRSSAWWASRRPRQVGPQPGLCTCHSAAQPADLAAPRRGLSSRAGLHRPPRGSVAAGRGPREPAAGGRGDAGGGVRSAGRALPADAEGRPGEGRSRGARAGEGSPGRALIRSGRGAAGEASAEPRDPGAPPPPAPFGPYHPRGGSLVSHPPPAARVVAPPPAPARPVLPQRASHSLRSRPAERGCSGAHILE